MRLLREWLEIRARVRDEYRFHLAQAQADGLAREPRRANLLKSRNAALRELGGDLAGLLALAHAHQFSASPWIRPLTLALSALLFAAISPDFAGIVKGFAGPITRSTPVMAPAMAIWAFVILLTPFILPKRPRAAAYGLFVLTLHAFASIIGWGVAAEVCNRITWPTMGIALIAFVAMLFAYGGIVFLQCRSWWHDLHQRCPICLEGLRLPATEGTTDRVLINSAAKESICIHGHGVLREDHWSRTFRRTNWDWLVRA